MRSDLLRLAGAAGLLTAVAGCEIEKVAIPRTEERIALHGVLSASAPSQVVLLERTRGGWVLPSGPPFDIPDPITSDEGVAETGATVTLTTPGGQTLVAIEDKDRRGDGQGGGVYRFALAGDQLVRGGTYRVTATTLDGDVLTGETVVPGGVAAMSAQPLVFDRAADTLQLEWPAAPGARSYFVRVETPYGPRAFFTDSTRVRFTGDLRNTDLQLLPHVFIPGFPQAITVSAVDSNYYDWFRTHNNRLTGTGLIGRVTGGFGVFGSLVRLRFLDLHVVAPQTERAAGHFRFDGTPFERSVTPYLRLELYVESRSARGDQPDAMSGRYDRRPFLGMEGCVTCGLFGSAQGSAVVLHFLREWSARDTVETFYGEIRGDTLIGRYVRAGGTARFIREP